MVEHTTVNRGVVGSSPTRGVSILFCIIAELRIEYAEVLELADRHD